MNKDVSITFAFDVLSPYSFLAYQTLTRYEKVWGLKLNYLPVSIPALFQLAQNKPPGDTCTHKRKYLINDLAYSAEYSKTSFKLPSKFPVDTGLSLTALNLIKVRLPQLFDVSLKAIWEGYFIHDRDISKPLIIQELLQEANVDKVDEILKDSSQEKFQVEILKNTESILSKGAFGLPFFITEGSDGEERCFFGSDRLRIMAHQLKLPYEGPVPGYEIKESSVGGSITFAFDVLSAYSYFAHQLLKRQNWRVKVDYRPVSLTKIMKLTGNIGPTFGSENKKRYTLGDLSHLSKLYDIPYKPPSKFPFNTALVQTLLAIIKERDQDGFIPALDLLWEATFVRSLEINDPNLIKDVLQPLYSQGQLKALPEWVEEASKKEVVDEYVVKPTNVLVNQHGAFGLPYFLVQKEKDASPRYFFGSDRLELMAYCLQLLYNPGFRATPHEPTSNL